MTDLPQRRFPMSASLELDLAVPEVHRLLVGDERVRWEPPLPLTPPAPGEGVVFNAGPIGESEGPSQDHRMYLRPSSAQGVGDLWVELDVRSTERGSRVAIRLLRKDPKAAATERKLSWAALVIGAGTLLVYVLGSWVTGAAPITGFTLFKVLGAVAATWVTLRVVNRPTRAALESYSHEVWTLLGRLFAQHELGQGSDNPFRNRELPPSRE